MLDFFAACARLFEMTFSAAVGVAFFRMLSGFLALELMFALFRLFYRGAGRL